MENYLIYSQLATLLAALLVFLLIAAVCYYVDNYDDCETVLAF
jgi:hypothetical protein